MLADGGTLLLGSMMLDDPELSELRPLRARRLLRRPHLVVGARAGSLLQMDARGRGLRRGGGVRHLARPPRTSSRRSAHTCGQRPGTAPHAGHRDRGRGAADAHALPRRPLLLAAARQLASSRPSRGARRSGPPRRARRPGSTGATAEQVALCERGLRRPGAPARSPPSRPTTRREYFTHERPVPGARRLAARGACCSHLRPARMIEVGSGFSSLVTARVNRELPGRRRCDFTCIEPYPRDFLLAGVPGHHRPARGADPGHAARGLRRARRRATCSSSTPRTRSRPAGTCAWIFGEILPRLAPGVVVHIHDVFLPGDYPEPVGAGGLGLERGLPRACVPRLQRRLPGPRSAPSTCSSAHREVRPDRPFPSTQRTSTAAAAALWIQRLSA